MFVKEFNFGVPCEKTSANIISVSPNDLYTLERGFGFVTEENRAKQELLQLRELNSGFVPFYWYQNEKVTIVEQHENGCFVDSTGMMRKLAEKGDCYPGEILRIPLVFKMSIPVQGNYMMEVSIWPDEDMEDVLLFAGRRHLVWKGNIKAGERFTFQTVVNVCDIIPRGKLDVYEDVTLDVAVVADKPLITALKVWNVTLPTIYIAGDSTVTDSAASYPYSPGASYSGWGQMLSAWLCTAVAVSNHAHSGLTTESFRQEGHHAIVRKYWKPGDYLLIQFGHNDQKLNHLKAREGYRERMIEYINEARADGVYPVIITPLARNTWKGNDGTYNDLLAGYAESCFEIGRDMDVPVLDLHGLSMAFVKEKGVQDAKPYFFPDDYTHSNDYGAYMHAGVIAQQMKEICGNRTESAYRFLADSVAQGFCEWIPGEIVLAEKPANYNDIKGPDAEVLLADVDNLDEPANRASVMDMLIKTCRFFPTNVYNDMFVDVVGHEWYAGTVETAYQNGMIIPEMVENDHLYPEKVVTLEDFLVLAMNAYQSRKPLPSGGIYTGTCRNYAGKYVKAAAALGIIDNSSADLERIVSRGEAVEMCRKMGI